MFERKSFLSIEFHRKKSFAFFFHPHWHDDKVFLIAFLPCFTCNSIRINIFPIHSMMQHTTIPWKLHETILSWILQRYHVTVQFKWKWIVLFENVSFLMEHLGFNLHTARSCAHSLVAVSTINNFFLWRSLHWIVYSPEELISRGYSYLHRAFFAWVCNLYMLLFRFNAFFLKVNSFVWVCAVFMDSGIFTRFSICNLSAFKNPLESIFPHRARCFQ